MSLTPETTPTTSEVPRDSVPPLSQREQVSGGQRRLGVVLFALFAFDIGTFLVVFPWMDSWTLNHLPSFFPGHEIELQDLWDDPYFRAALSSLGLLNLYISLREAFQLIRRSKQT